MKVTREQKPTEFVPVHIILDKKEELDDLYALLVGYQLRTLSNKWLENLRVSSLVSSLTYLYKELGRLKQE